MGARGDRRWVANLEAAIEEAVAAGVEGEQLRNARERLEDFRAEAELEAAEYAIDMALRRATAPAAGAAATSELVNALRAAIEAGVSPALVRSARSIVESKGTREQIDVVKLYDRLERFKQIAERCSTEGERENAERMVAQAREKLAKLSSPAGK